VRDLKRPFLGVCLGHQLLADALGGTCGPVKVPEIGVYDVELNEAGASDPLFAGMPRRQTCLQWHSVEVAQPPDDAVVLASAPGCRVQAMRVGRNAWSMQYHVEVEPDTVEKWLAIPTYEDALVRKIGADNVGAIRTKVAAEMAAFNAASRRLYENFKAAIGVA
jgi:GMP synthase-like glutamine amidotransferase